MHTVLTLAALPVVHWLSASHPFDLSRTDPATTCLQTAALLTSSAYYLYDSVDILQNDAAPLRPPSIYFLLHHAICVGGLLSPVVCGVDGTLVLVGLMLGEVANPPRVWAQLVAWQLAQRRQQPLSPAPAAAAAGMSEQSSTSIATANTARSSTLTVPHPSQLRGREQVRLWLLHSTLSSVHFLLFASTRALGVWYYVGVLWPYSASRWTALWGGLLCAFSVATVVQYVVSSEGVNVATTAPERRTDQHTA